MKPSQVVEANVFGLADWHKILTSKERAAQNEESPEWQAQLELIHDLIQPVMARMNEIRKQEVATEQDLDRPKLLFTEYKNFKGKHGLTTLNPDANASS